MTFSVLLSIYHRTQADELAKCLDSLLSQTLPADEVVVIKDGPLQPDVDRCLQDYTGQLPIRLFSYPKNRGLGPVLADSLIRCKHELVARVDTDDRCLPGRFSVQIDYLHRNKDISVVGGALQEYYTNNITHKSVIRNGPITPSEVAKFAKRRNPLNHPTVMFRKSHVLSCGGYEECDFFEDYYLWAKMIHHGYRIANIPNILVETDVTADYFKRRGGLSYIAKELHLLKRLRQLCFFSMLDGIVFVSTRIPIRLLPWMFRQNLYRFFLRNL